MSSHQRGGRGRTHWARVLSPTASYLTQRAEQQSESLSTWAEVSSERQGADNALATTPGMPLLPRSHRQVLGEALPRQSAGGALAAPRPPVPGRRSTAAAVGGRTHTRPHGAAEG